MKQQPAPPSSARVRRSAMPPEWKRTVVAAGVALAWAFGPAHHSAAAGSEGVRLSPKLEQGRTLSYDISRTLRVEQTPGEGPGGATGHASPTVSSTTLDIAVRLDVGSVRADGTTEVVVEIQSLQLAIETPGVTRSFRHPSDTTPAEGDEVPVAPKGDESARPSAIDMVGRALVLSKPRIVINREGGLGEILGLENLDEIVAAAGKMDRTVPAVDLSTWGSDAIRALLLPVFQPAAPEPPARVLKPGDRWTVRRTADLARLGSLVIDEAWTLGAEVEGQTGASGLVTVTPTPPRGIVSAAPALELGAYHGKASLSWDTGSASLASFSRELNLTMTLNLGDLRIIQTQSSATGITRRD